MRLSLKWLSDYIELPAPPRAIADALDGAGFEVESIRRMDEGVGGVVVGRVESVGAHPDADRLRVCEVDAGGDRLLPVVCGASNFEQGAVVAFAPVGAELPGGMRIEKRKIRGAISEGMICSAAELGIGDDAAGIMVLSPDLKAGTPVAEALGLDDTVIELSITPNRPDAMSVLGLAREIAAAFGVAYQRLEPKLAESAPSTASVVAVENRAPERCPRYTARLVDGVVVGASPEWMSRRLMAAGVRLINNVVDVTNFVLMECGQPLHAFDLALLASAKVIVRLASDGEKMTTLDGVERELSARDLVIADEGGPVALAGIMGGESSEIRDATQAVLLESAYFEPRGILVSSKQHGLRSESSARFERGTDPEGTAWAAERAAALVAETAGGRVAEGAIDCYPEPYRAGTITLRSARANSILGVALSAGEQAALLRSIDLEVTSVDTDEIEVATASFRPDIEREIDLIEEVGRLNGYDRLTPSLPASAARMGGLTRRQALRLRLSEALRAAGLNEVKTMSFVGPGDLLNDEQAGGKVALVANPLRAEESILRPSLAPGLLKAAGLNLARRRGEVRLFEMGKTFGAPKNGIPSEAARVGGVIVGSHESESAGYFGAKGVIELVIEALRLEGVDFEPAGRPGMLGGRTAEVRVGEWPAGYVAEVHPKLLERLEIPGRACLFELDEETFLGGVPEVLEYREISRYPVALLDVALVVDEGVPVGAVQNALAAAGGDELESCRLFDVYRGAQIGAGKKSLAFSLGFSSPSGTLAEAEVLGMRDRLVAAARRECGAEMRGG